MTETKLKPCPFCGTAAYQSPTGVTCPAKSCRPGWRDIDDWNTRPGEEAAREEGRQQERERIIATLDASRTEMESSESLEFMSGLGFAWGVVSAMHREAAKEEAEAEGAKDGR